ncbi:MAG: hypothetical protein AB1894_15750 [Chloroflexota bacterium]
MTEPKPTYTENLRLTLGSLLSSAPPSPGRGAGPAPDPSRPREYRARFVRAGQVLDTARHPANLFVEPQALEAAAQAGMFTNKAVFIDHTGFFDENYIDRLAGVTLNGDYNPVDQSIEGTIRLYSTPTGQAIATLLDEIVADPSAAPDVGLSIVFYPQYAPRDNPDEPRRIIGFRHIESVDLVFQPAADGRILQALSSAAIQTSVGTQGLRPEPTPSEGDNPMPDQTPTPGALDSANLPSPVETGQAVPLPDPGPWIQELASTISRQVIATSGLPQASQQRLSAGSYATPEELQAAIESERAYLAALQENQVIQIGGTPPRSPHIAGMRNSLDQLSLALDALINGTRPADGVFPLTGIRELYHHLSGDYEMNGVFQPDRIQFANVNSSTMSNMVANVLNKRVINEFMQYPHWWTPIVKEEDFASLQAVRWITLGGVGELPTVSEGAAYTELTWDDSYESASFIKKGGYLGITLEAIDKDDTGRLRAAPQALAQAAWLTLGKAISAIFTANSGTGPTISDATALFTSGHGNLGSTALSITELNVVRTAMRKMTEPNSSERLGALTAPKYILVPPDLEMTALQVLASELNYLYALSNGPAAPANTFTEGNDVNARMAYAKSRVIVMDLWTDTNNWAAVCDPNLWPTIGVGYRYGRVPEILSVASPTAGLMFTNDTMPVKARFFFAVGPMDYRGMYKENVA